MSKPSPLTPAQAAELDQLCALANSNLDLLIDTTRAKMADLGREHTIATGAALLPRRYDVLVLAEMLSTALVRLVELAEQRKADSV